MTGKCHGNTNVLLVHGCIGTIQMQLLMKQQKISSPRRYPFVRHRKGFLSI
jgi:hypothetical protein